MMSSFQSSIRQTETALIVVGFGFNDDHISNPIISALQSNLNLKLVVIAPHFFDGDNGDHIINSPTITHPHHKKLAELIASGDSRIAFISASFEEFSNILLPDLVAETDRERHAERFRRLREGEQHAE